MPKTPEVTTWAETLIPSSFFLRTEHLETMTLTDGVVYTPHGIVSVMARTWRDGTKITHMEFGHMGLVYHRHIDNFYSQRYLVTLACRFTAEIIEEKA